MFDLSGEKLVKCSLYFWAYLVMVLNYLTLVWTLKHKTDSVPILWFAHSLAHTAAWWVITHSLLCVEEEYILYLLCRQRDMTTPRPSRGFLEDRLNSCKDSGGNIKVPGFWQGVVNLAGKCNFRNIVFSPGNGSGGLVWAKGCQLFLLGLATLGWFLLTEFLTLVALRRPLCIQLVPHPPETTCDPKCLIQQASSSCDDPPSLLK